MRDVSQLHPDLQKKIAELQTLCDKNGLKIGISECLRSLSEQDALYAKGRTAPGSVVTNARGSTFSSMHQWGVAFDFYRNDGKGAYNDGDGFFSKVGKLGVSLGLEWGGNWKSIVDKPHFQLPDWGSTTTILKSQYGTPEKFFSTWKYENEYGDELPEKKFRVIKDCFLRTSPEVNRNKVPYGELTTTLKKKCRNKNGFAVFNADSTFTRIRSYKDINGNKWKQMKSGYWLPVIFEGVRMAELI